MALTVCARPKVGTLDHLCTCEWSLLAGRMVVRPAPGHKVGKFYVRDSETLPWRGLPVRELTFEGNVVTRGDLSGAFAGIEGVRRIDLSRLDASGVVSLRNAFALNPSLEELLLPEGELTKLQELDGAFEGCTSLRSLRLPKMPSLKSASTALFECTALESIDLSPLAASRRVENVASMLSGCTSLREVRLDGWEQLRPRNLSRLFEGCESLESIPASTLNVSEATDISFCFSECSSLTDLDIHGWDVRNCEDLSGLFSSCTSLEVLGLAGWRVDGNIATAPYLFAGCESLWAVSLSSWEGRGLDALAHAFDDCPRLKFVNFDGWDPAEAAQAVPDGCAYSVTNSEGNTYLFRMERPR